MYGYGVRVPSPYRFSGPVDTYPYSPEALALFAAMTVQPSPAVKQRYDQFLVAVAAAGLPAKLDGIWLYRGAHHEQASRLNVLVPAQAASVAVGSPTFAMASGWTNTAAGGLQLPLTWNALSKLSLNSETMGVRIGGGTDAAATEYAMGQSSGSIICGFRPRDASGQFSAYMGTGVVTNFFLNPGLVGHYTAVRLGAGLLKGYKNGVAVGGLPTTASVSLSAGQIMVGQHNANGNDFVLECAYVGAALDDADVTTLDTAFSAFMV